jgi:uncharacterized protein YhhL (DUF1145 family)
MAPLPEAGDPGILDAHTGSGGSIVVFKKAALAVLWLVCLAGFFVQKETTTAFVGRGLFVALLVIHSMQWLAFRELMKGSANGTLGNLTGTLLFGILHIQEVRAEVEGKSAES